MCHVSLQPTFHNRFENSSENSTLFFRFFKWLVGEPSNIFALVLHFIFRHILWVSLFMCFNCGNRWDLPLNSLLTATSGLHYSRDDTHYSVRVRDKWCHCLHCILVFLFSLIPTYILIYFPRTFRETDILEYLSLSEVASSSSGYRNTHWTSRMSAFLHDCFVLLFHLPDYIHV
jgi:hypothetical protein